MENNNYFSLFFLCLLEYLFLLSAIIEANLHGSLATPIQKNNSHKKKYLIIGIVLPLIILFIFKYFNFFISDIFRIDLHEIQFLLKLTYQ